MNQTDYKKIAEIINLNLTIGWVGVMTQNELFVMQETERKLRNKYAKKLADYFEKENPLIFTRNDKFKGFNKKQFLKDCGVD